MASRWSPLLDCPAAGTRPRAGAPGLAYLDPDLALDRASRRLAGAVAFRQPLPDPADAFPRAVRRPAGAAGSARATA